MLTYVVSFNPWNCDHLWVSLPLCRGRSWGPERLCDLPKVTQLLSREAVIQICVCLILTRSLSGCAVLGFLSLGHFLATYFSSPPCFLYQPINMYVHVLLHRARITGTAKKYKPYYLLSWSVGRVSKTPDSTFSSLYETALSPWPAVLFQHRQALFSQLHHGDSWNIIFQSTELYHHYCI